MDRIPIPPGHTGTRLVGNHAGTRLQVIADYPGSDVEKITAFYEAFFKENGWQYRLRPDGAIKGLLASKSGRMLMDIIILNRTGQLQMSASYQEYGCTHKEFSELRRQTAAPEALEIACRVLETYAGLASYADSGSLESCLGGMELKLATFETRFVRPDRLLFAYSETLGKGFRSSHTLGRRGDSVQSMSNMDDIPIRETDLSHGIGRLYGVTGRTSGNIPFLLFGLGGGTLFHLSELKALAGTPLQDGTPCLRLKGTDFAGNEKTIWIGREDLLLRKIELLDDVDKHRTTIYAPRANIEIPAEELEFRIPTAGSP